MTPGPCGEAEPPRQCVPRQCLETRMLMLPLVPAFAAGSPPLRWSRDPERRVLARDGDALPVARPLAAAGDQPVRGAQALDHFHTVVGIDRPQLHPALAG